MKTAIITLIFLGIISCKSGRERCQHQYTSFDGVKQDIKGCFVDSLEQGKWVIYDSSRSIVEEGNFARGLRVEHGDITNRLNFPVLNGKNLTVKHFEFELIS